MHREGAGVEGQECVGFGPLHDAGEVDAPGPVMHLSLENLIAQNDR